MLAASEAESASSTLDDPSIYAGTRKSQTWFFRAYVRLKDGKTIFSNLLDARKPQLDTALPTASLISWACTNISARIQTQHEDSNGKNFEGFCHALTLIRLGSLRRVLPNQTAADAGENVEVTFEEVKPGPGKK
jgi:hypothetical protein